MPAFGFGRRLRPRRIGAAGPSAPIPANYDFVVFGDSRTENGLAVSNTSGLTEGTTTIGMQAWLELLSGYKLRLAERFNFAISASTTYQGAALPRQNALGAVTAGDYWRSAGSANFSDNKGAEFLSANSCGWVLFLYGTNDGTVSDAGYSAASRTNVTTMLDRAPDKVWVLCNELPKGIRDDGTSGGQTVSANFKGFSDWIKTLSFDSGHANARSNVIVVDTFAAIVDPASGAANNNLRGTLHDGLHWAPGGARMGAQAVLTKLQSVWPWASIPSRVSFPTTNGLSAIANAQPFIQSNPIFTPGTNGAISGTWGTAPNVANIPQGWTVFAQSNASGLTAVADKTGTDPDGFPTFKLTISGTLGAGLAAQIQVFQTASIATLFSGSLITINDRLRGVGKAKISPGSQYLQGVALAAILGSPTTAKFHTKFAARGTTVLNAAAPAFIDAFASGEWLPYQTPLIDMQDPGKVALAQNITAQADINQLQIRWEIDFRNLTASTQNVSGVFEFSRTGMARV